MTLFETVFSGNDAVYGLTEGAINAAIEQHGADKAVSFPNTAYSLPCYYAVTGVKVNTLGELKEALGVDTDVASFTAGLGANVGMPACAGIWPALTAVFSVHMLGYHYGIAQYVFLILITLVVSVGTVGVPGTATITSTAVFAALGLPIELVVVFAPISTIVDMARTMTNVTGAATAAVITAATEGLVDEEVYNSDQAKHVAVNN